MLLTHANAKAVIDAPRNKIAGISGSNDTTGKDCVRYGFRQNFYGETAANAIGPVLLKAYGKNKKAAYMTPDYTYGHTVTKSINDYLNKNGGWTMVTNQVSPLGAPDYSSYLTNIANSGAEFLHQRQLGPRRGAVDAAGEAVRHPAEDEARHPLPDSVPRQEVGAEHHRGRVRRDRLLVDARGQVSAREDVRRRVPEEVRLQARNGAPRTPTWVRAVGRSGRARRHASIRPT